MSDSDYDFIDSSPDNKNEENIAYDSQSDKDINEGTTHHDAIKRSNDLSGTIDQSSRPESCCQAVSTLVAQTAALEATVSRALAGITSLDMKMSANLLRLSSLDDKLDGFFARLMSLISKSFESGKGYMMSLETIPNTITELTNAVTRMDNSSSVMLEMQSVSLDKFDQFTAKVTFQQ